MEMATATLTVAATTMAASVGKLVHTTAAMASTPAALCGITAAVLAWMRTRPRYDDGLVRALHIASHAACAITGFAAAMALCRQQQPTSLLACAAASITVEEATAALLTHGPLGMLGFPVTALARIATSISAAAVIWCAWNLCFVGPASIISPPLIALRACHGTLVWAVMIAPAVYPLVALCHRGLRAVASFAAAAAPQS
ncbi:hypothetical protein pclt_cds_38 [Pandoravirus celtis]|uniref:Uncharacterized protein n=1 Tax=Pandoravirus celtis TaxID=2568002 RepID=A0A4D6EFH7_9VIRU|nr:hypothetical protein pclt_cds_38 [Pandoravirus celtis]